MHHLVAASAVVEWSHQPAVLAMYHPLQGISQAEPSSWPMQRAYSETPFRPSWAIAFARLVTAVRAQACFGSDFRKRHGRVSCYRFRRHCKAAVKSEPDGCSLQVPSNSSLNLPSTQIKLPARTAMTATILLCSLYQNISIQLLGKPS